MKILFLNGPNLNMLGIREPEIYGTQTLNYINEIIKSECEKIDVVPEFFQSNCEGALIEKIHSTHFSDISGIVFNPGAYSHYSIAIADALKAVSTPTVEVHMSNIFAREDKRQNMVTAVSSKGVISGFGAYSYILGLYALVKGK